MRDVRLLASEYGDDRDMMGMSSIGHFNAFQKERLGWLNYGSSPGIQNVTSSGTYWVEAYGTPSNGGPKALRILKSTDSGGGRTWYYIESRAQLGFDNGFARGVTIHSGSETTGNSSYQIDLLPTSSSFDSLLDPSQVFTDPSLDLAITTVSATNAGAFVTISYPGVPCTPGAPTVSLSPGSTLGQLGQPTSVTLSVRNNDNASACSPVAFGLDATVPSGWSARVWPVVAHCCSGLHGHHAADGHADNERHGPGECGRHAADHSGSRRIGFGDGQRRFVAQRCPVDRQGQRVSDFGNGEGRLHSRCRACRFRSQFATRSARSQPRPQPPTVAGLRRSPFGYKGKDPKGTYSVTATTSSGGLDWHRDRNTPCVR